MMLLFLKVTKKDLRQKLIITDKKFNVLRSPFVYSKSKEHFGYTKYLLKINLPCFFDMISYLFFMNMQNHYTKYSLSFFKRKLK